jgi:hypothetical protein
MREPATYGGWLGVKSDSRKTLVVSLEGSHFRDTSLNQDLNGEITVHWNQSSSINHNLELEFHNRQDDTQYLATVVSADHPGAQGIGGLSYLFGRIHQQTASVTLRTNLLFSRDKSLEIYAQPFITVGDYAEVRELIRPDSYDFIHYMDSTVDPHSNDFSFTAVNWNVVYRWEYRPGSAIYLVWTQSRSEFDERDFHPANPGGFNNAVRAGSLFRTEAENKVLAKITYWFAI